MSVRGHLIVFERLWQLGKVPEGCEKATVTLISKKSKKKDPVN